MSGKAVLKYISNIIGVMLALFFLLVAYIFVDFSPKQAPLPNKVNLVNDVTQLNPIEVSQVISPKSISDIQKAIGTSNGKVSIGGGRYSQGGQIALEDHLHLDMRDFNQVVAFNPEAKEITVQSGIRWRDIQDIIDTEDLSI